MVHPVFRHSLYIYIYIVYSYIWNNIVLCDLIYIYIHITYILTINPILRLAINSRNVHLLQPRKLFQLEPFEKAVEVSRGNQSPWNHHWNETFPVGKYGFETSCGLGSTKLHFLEVPWVENPRKDVGSLTRKWRDEGKKCSPWSVGLKMACFCRNDEKIDFRNYCILKSIAEIHIIYDIWCICVLLVSFCISIVFLEMMNFRSKGNWHDMFRRLIMCVLQCSVGGGHRLLT